MLVIIVFPIICSIFKFTELNNICYIGSFGITAAAIYLEYLEDKSNNLTSAFETIVASYNVYLHYFISYVLVCGIQISIIGIVSSFFNK